MYLLRQIIFHPELDEITGEPTGEVYQHIFVNEQESGIFPYKFSETVDEGWEDVTSITNIHMYGLKANLDFQQRHSIIRGLSDYYGFNTLTVDEQAIVAFYCAGEDEDLVTYYATNYTSGDVLAALNLHGAAIGNFISELRTVANYRYNHPDIITTVMLFLKDRIQIDSFTSAIRNLINDYLSKFHLGIVFGDSIDGIADFILNTGGYTALGGLNSFVFSDIQKGVWYATNAVDPENPTVQEQEDAHDYVRDLMKDKLINILVYGDFS